MKKLSINIRLRFTRITILVTMTAAAQGGWVKKLAPLLSDRSEHARVTVKKP